MSDDIAALVSAFYERHPYPPPVDDLAAYRQSWNDRRRRADAALFWPAEPYRDDRSILVAGCGTSQAAHYAVRWPRARVVGIDVSASSIAFTRELKRTHGLENLELHHLPVERAVELGESFEHVVCTGVLHHLSDPEAGLRALREVLAPNGALHAMVYAPYGRAGVYLLQAYCRQLGIGTSDAEIRDLVTTLRALPADHPLAPLLRNSPDFADPAGLADALLHPQDRSYTIPELFAFVAAADLTFGRWVRQAPYLPWCGSFASTPHRDRVAALELPEQYAALERFRGTMTRHGFAAYRSPERARAAAFNADDDAWLDATPIRTSHTVTVRERLPAGAAAVLINRNHTSTDLYLPVTADELALLEAVDGERTVGAIARAANVDPSIARRFFVKLWRWDQIVAVKPPLVDTR